MTQVLLRNVVRRWLPYAIALQRGCLVGLVELGGKRGWRCSILSEGWDVVRWCCPLREQQQQQREKEKEREVKELRVLRREAGVLIRGQRRGYRRRLRVRIQVIRVSDWWFRGWYSIPIRRRCRPRREDNLWEEETAGEDVFEDPEMWTTRNENELGLAEQVAVVLMSNQRYGVSFFEVSYGRVPHQPSLVNKVSELHLHHRMQRV